MRPLRVAEAAGVLGGAGLLVGSWAIVVADDAVPEWEVSAFRRVNGLPDALWPVVWAPMQAGSFVGSFVIAGVATAVTKRPRLGVAALGGAQASFWTAKLIKGSAGRGRPTALLTEVSTRESATGLGYVSGHAAVAFALAAALAPSAPRPWRPALFAGATLVTLARQYAGVHLPLDGVGGAGLGLLSGTLARWAFGIGGFGIPPRHDQPRSAW